MSEQMGKLFLHPTLFEMKGEAVPNRPNEVAQELLETTQTMSKQEMIDLRDGELDKLNDAEMRINVLNRLIDNA